MRIYFSFASLLTILLVTFSIKIGPSVAALAFGSDLQVCQPPLQPVIIRDSTLVTDCTQAGLQSALDLGGQITFDCGPGPVTIPLTSQLELSTQAGTTLDGGGLVTLDGQGLTRILHKNWHDPVTVGEIRIALQNLRFVNGKAPSGGSTGDHSGGAISVGHPGTRLHIINATFEDNTTRDQTTTDNQGGAIFVHNAYETIISGASFTGNSAGNGGAIGAIASGMLIFNSHFSGNHATDLTSGGIVRGYGGALHLDGVTNSYNPNSRKRLHVCGSLFEHNQAVRGGGALGVVISDNQGTLATYEKSTFNGNTVSGVDGEAGQGGAIYHIEDDHAGGIDEFNLLVSQSTFHANQALRQGGALWVYILGHGQVVNNTFEGNRTSAPYDTVGQGGAMVVTLGLIDIANTTFANNHAAYQAGALHGGGTNDPRRSITLSNTVFYNNTLNEQQLPSPTEWQGYHTNRPMLDGGANIQYPRLKPTYENEVNNNITANPIYLDPRLASLTDNGGPTHTMALLEGSPAIDQGLPSTCPGNDQRGYLRDGPCDIGSYEFNGAPFTPEEYIFLPVIIR